MEVGREEEEGGGGYSGHREESMCDSRGEANDRMAGLSHTLIVEERPS